MPYAVYADMEARYPNRDLVQITNEDPSQTSVNTEYLTQYLGDASAEIDAYLESRFSLPLSDPPAILNQLCTTIAMYKMQVLRPLADVEEARKRYDDAIAFLMKVADGKLTLGLSTDSQEPPDAVPTVLSLSGGVGDSPPPSRVFGRRNLKGF